MRCWLVLVLSPARLCARLSSDWTVRYELRRLSPRNEYAGVDLSVTHGIVSMPTNNNDYGFACLDGGAKPKRAARVPRSMDAVARPKTQSSYEILRSLLPYCFRGQVSWKHSSEISEKIQLFQLDAGAPFRIKLRTRM